MKRLLERAFPLVNRISPAFAGAVRRWFNQSVTKRIQGTDNQLRYESAVLNGVTFDIIGSGNVVEIGEASLTGLTFRIRGDHHRIVIPRGCRFNQGGVIWFEDDHCQLVIGEDSSFENVHIAVTEPGSVVSIGRDCMFAYHIDVRTGDSHAIIDALNGTKINQARNIAIGNHVWVAAHCIILKGVSIADNSVVATGSVVTKSSDQPGSILAGNPAIVVKQGITWTREKFVPNAPQPSP